MSIPTGPAGGQPLGSEQPLDLTQTFKLHSKAGSTKVVYLDFVGSTVENTAWNSSYTNYAPIVTPPFGQDGDSSTFSDAELATIQRIWQRVSEDYAPFDVDITTEPPTKPFLGSDRFTGQRVIIGGDGSWYGNRSGGVSFTNSYGSVNPCWVFAANLGNAEKAVAEAVAHETGHSMGLSHDGTSGSLYYSGGGGWAPIMGNSYKEPLTQFSKGEYPDANQLQDDVAKIAAKVGVRADDYGDSFATATTLTSGQTVAGLISTATDTDVFKFEIKTIPVAVKLQPAALGADLYAKVSLYDSAGTLISSGTPAAMDNLTVNLNSDLTVGTYYVVVDGVGSPAAPTDYGSMGQYWLTVTTAGTVPPVSPPPPPPVSPPPPPPPAGSVFVGSDNTTQGKWIGKYGSAAYVVAKGATSLPAGFAVTPASKSDYVWSYASGEVRALQVPNATSGIASCWYAQSGFTVDVAIPAGQSKTLSVYFLDWDNQGRSESVEVIDANGVVIDSRTVANFTGGLWLSWAITGNCRLKFARTAGSNAVLSGLFFD